MSFDEPEFDGTERYVVRRRIGAGTTGLIYEALDRELGQCVALKTLRRVTPREIDRMKEEFRSLANVHHPNLIGLHDLFVAGSKCFFSMDLVEGVDFLTFVGVADNCNLLRLRTALGQLVLAVLALHAAGKLHRDIKPSNVLVTPAGHVVVLDFGLVDDLDRPRAATDDVAFVGTPAYVAPEVAFGATATEASDWYSVGTMLYEALAGRHPFSGDPSGLLMRKRGSQPPPPVATPHAADELGALAMALLQAEPHERPDGTDIARRLGLSKASERVRQPEEPRFVGRRAHLDEIDQAFASSRSGATILLVHGDSGMGKTTLIRRYLERARSDDNVLVAVGKCYERESTQFKAFDALMSDLASQLQLSPPLAIDRDMGHLVQLFPVLDTVPIIAELAVGTTAVHDPRERRSRAFDALRDLLCALSRVRPVILSVDDLQWADSDSAALFEAIFGDPQMAPPVLFLGTYRSRDVPVSGFLSAILDRKGHPRAMSEVKQLELRAMTDHEAEELAVDLLVEGSREGSAPEVESLVRESKGCPFLLVELAQNWTESPISAPDASPSTRLQTQVDAMIERRLSRISPAARQVLEFVAAAGRPMDQGLLRRLVPSTERALHDVRVLRIEKLIRGSGFGDRQLIESYHDRIRETVTACMDADRLRAVHRELAVALVESGDVDPRVVVEHWVMAGDVREIQRYASVAATEAAHNLAFDEAVRYRKLAIEANDQPSAELGLFVALADALVDAGRGQDAGRTYLQAASRTEGTERLALRCKAADQLLGSGRLDEGRELMAEVLAEQGLQLHATRARSLAEYAVSRGKLRARGMRYALRRVGDIPTSLRDKIDACTVAAADIGVIDPLRGAYFRSLCLQLSLEAGEPVRLSRALTLEAIYVATGGGRGLKRALELCEQSEMLAKHAGTEEALATVEMAKGICYSLSGRWREAVTHCDKAIAAYTERCSAPRQWELGVSQSWATAALFYLGEHSEVSGRLPVYLGRAEERGDIYTATSLAVSDGVLSWLLEGDVEKPRRVIREGMSRWPNDGFYMQHWLEIHALSYVDLYEGDCTSVLRRFEQNWPDIRRSLLLNVQTCRGTSAYLRGSAALRLAARSPVNRWRHLALAQRCEWRLFFEGMPWTRGMGFLLRAGQNARQGREKDAAGALEAAVQEFQRADMPLWGAAAELRLAAIGNDDRRDARARAWMAGHGVRHPDRVVEMLSPWPERRL